MNADKYTIKFLGVAFLIQAVVPAVSGLILSPIDLLAPSVPGNIIDSMTIISNNALRVRASIVGEMIAVIGLVLLGILLYVTLEKQNGKIAFVAMGLYLIEAAILAAREIAVFALLRISQESVIAGYPAYLQTLGNLFYEVQSFGYSLLMVPFALGATLFYYLFYKSGYIPRSLNLFGLIAASLACIGTPFALLGYDVPIFVFLPSLPFEITIGLWLLVKGISDGSETK